MFLCFLIRPTPYERRYQQKTLICLFNLPEIDYTEMSFRELLYAVLNCVLFTCAVMYLLQMRAHIKNVGRKMYFLSLSGFPAKAIFLVSCFLVVFSFALRIFCLDKFEDVIWVSDAFVGKSYQDGRFVNGADSRGFKTVGPFVLMLYKIIIRDLSRFFIIYTIIVIGFSQAFYVIFLGYRRDDPTYNRKEDRSAMSTIPDTFVRMFMMSLTEFAVFFEQLEQCDLRTVGKITFLVYMLLVTMLLINMLIAMMTNTYTEVSANSLEWLRQWSAIIMMMEQSFDPKTRLYYQRCYSKPMEGGKRIALVLKLRLSEEDQENQRRETQRRRAKFREDMLRENLSTTSERNLSSASG
ncbi:CRE-OCR-4 protein [Aphelenchoides avenae]|nr:CRE-OCR-4 protein [Aphelenchus avenae]